MTTSKYTHPRVCVRFLTKNLINMKEAATIKDKHYLEVLLMFVFILQLLRLLMKKKKDWKKRNILINFFSHEFRAV